MVVDTTAEAWERRIRVRQHGSNDHLVVDANVTLRGNLEIYNNWGLLIYSSQAYSNTWPEKDTEAGVYFYRFAFDTCPPDKGWV